MCRRGLVRHPKERLTASSNRLASKCMPLVVWDCGWYGCRLALDDNNTARATSAWSSGLKYGHLQDAYHPVKDYRPLTRLKAYLFFDARTAFWMRSSCANRALPFDSKLFRFNTSTSPRQQDSLRYSDDVWMVSASWLQRCVLSLLFEMFWIGWNF